MRKHEVYFEIWSSVYFIISFRLIYNVSGNKIKFAAYTIFLMNNVLFKVDSGINECYAKFIIALNAHRDSFYLRDLIRQSLETVATSRTITGGETRSRY